MSPLLSCQSLAKSHGARPLFEDISFGIFQNDKIAIIGPNGSGKSTLLRIIAGLDVQDDGVISKKKSLRVGYVPQESEYGDVRIEDILFEKMKDAPEFDDYQKIVHVRKTLSKVGFSEYEQKANTLSGGWKKRLDIAKELVLEPDILLLDEPTNHLDIEGIQWLENFLLRTVSTYLLISHDRVFLENCASKVLELNSCYPRGTFLVDGNYSAFLERRDAFLSGQSQYEQSLRSKARREIEWLRSSPKARTTKSRSRIQEAHKLLGELESVKKRNTKQTADINFTASDIQTRKLVTLTNVSKSIGGKELFTKVNLTLSPGTRLGILGPNGSGKTTMLKIIAGEIAPDMGTVKYADGLKIVYFDQHRRKLPPETTLRNALAPQGEFVTWRGQQIHVNGWCKRFLFSPERLDFPIGQLSGGERARVNIARLMLEPADILLLDEPTNDLDIPTLEMLEENLEEFTGALVLITHDRYMLENMCTSLLAVQAPQDRCLFADLSQWEEFQKNSQKKTPEFLSQEKSTKEALPQQEKIKLSYKEKKELEQMEANIQTLESEIATLQSKLNSNETLQDFSKIASLGEEIKRKEEDLEKLFCRWQELESKSQGL